MWYGTLPSVRHYTEAPPTPLAEKQGSGEIQNFKEQVLSLQVSLTTGSLTTTASSRNGDAKKTFESVMPHSLPLPHCDSALPTPNNLGNIANVRFEPVFGSTRHQIWF